MSNPARDALKRGIEQTALALGISPIDLATAISYETAGTFDPTKRGPTTQWGQHRGLIQFGEPQARKYGVDWSNPLGSQLGPDGAVAKYLRDTGVKPGMGLLDVYSAINAGGVGLYHRSDANNGGAPGTVADKVRDQMHGHRKNAERLFGGAAQPAPVQAQPSPSVAPLPPDRPAPGSTLAQQPKTAGQGAPVLPPMIAKPHTDEDFAEIMAALAPRPVAAPGQQEAEAPVSRQSDPMGPIMQAIQGVEMARQGVQTATPDLEALMALRKRPVRA